jgi:hypothetical protein
LRVQFIISLKEAYPSVIRQLAQRLLRVG